MLFRAAALRQKNTKLLYRDELFQKLSLNVDDVFLDVYKRQSSSPSVSIDGRFGAATEAAVRAYQRFAGLTVDGIVAVYKRQT